MTPTSAARSPEPLMPLFDFGTANYKEPEGTKKSLLIGVEREKGKRQPNKFSKEGDDVVKINPLPLALAAAPLVLVTAIFLSFFLLAPGTSLPFNFLDQFYPPRVQEMKMQAEKREAFSEAKAAKAKAEKDALEAKAKAEEAEKAAKEAAAAKAAKAAPAAAAKK